jgi:hypothetical protein
MEELQQNANAFRGSTLPPLDDANEPCQGAVDDPNAFSRLKAIAESYAACPIRPRSQRFDDAVVDRRRDAVISQNPSNALGPAHASEIAIGFDQPREHVSGEHRHESPASKLRSPFRDERQERFATEIAHAVPHEYLTSRMAMNDVPADDAHRPSTA